MRFNFKTHITYLHTQIWKKSTSNYALEESNNQINEVEFE